MYGTEHKLFAGARVRLRATVDPSIYGEYACFGNEGVVKAMRKDRFGLPEVYVQWDQNHWAYNGVGDCWTYEDHFELTEDMMGSKQDKVQELMAMFAQGLSAIIGDEETPQNGRGLPPDEVQPTERLRNRLLEAAAPFQQEDEEDAFARAVESVTARLGGSEAFIVIGIDHQEHPAAPKGLLKPYALGFSKTPEGELLATAHMSEMAANAHQNLVLETITRSQQNDVS